MVTTDPIIIAGAGPAGSVLALYLGQRGIPVVLLEKEARLPIDLRASTFHPPSLEMIDKLGEGIIDDMIGMGLIADRYQYRDRRTNEVATFQMKYLQGETKYPFRLQLEQYEFTFLANRAMQKYPNIDVLFGSELVNFAQDEDGVTATVKTESGHESIRGAFLVGTEGAHSVCRKLCGIGYGGFTYDERFLVVSTSFRFEDVFDDLSYVNYVSDPEEWCVILRTDKLWRVLVPATPDSENDETFLLSDVFIQERLHHLYNKRGDYDIAHRTLYSVNQRVAETYYNGRVVLAGDACHINNPLGGMGMNGGIHDAYNLAQKMKAIVVNGADHIGKFEHYNRQRRDLAVRFVQEHTIANKKLMEATDTYTQNSRQKLLMESAADPVKAKAFLMERAMINCVRDSEAVA
ncbi:MAG: NAD(P)/FAD-dependent oxidoreductase [Haliea sp.]